MSRTRIAAALVSAGICFLSAGALAATVADRATPGTPSVRAPALTLAQIAARQKFFGIENVNANTGAVKPNEIIFSWATNTTFAVSVLGRVILMDSYVTRLEL